MSFDPVRIYDAPNVAVTQLLDGEASFGSLRKTFLAPAKLSYAERDSYVTRLKEAAGNTTVGNTVLDIATNPWVWFMFLTSPAGGSAIAKGARSAYGVAARNSAFVRKHSPMLAVLHTALQAFDGTPVTDALQDASETVRRLDEEWDAIIKPQLDKVLDRHAIDSVNPTRVVGPKRQMAEDIDDLIGISLGGFDRDVQVFVPTLQVTAVKTLPGGKQRVLKNQRQYVRAKQELAEAQAKGLPAPFTLDPKVEIIKGMRPRARWVTADVEAALAERGATEYRDAVKAAMQRRYRAMYGMDDAEGFVVDKTKAVNLWRAIQNPLFNGEDAGRVFQAKELLGKMVSQQLSDAIEAGVLTEAQFVDLVDAVVRTPYEQGYYVPLNKAVYLGKEGEIPFHKIQSMRQASRLRAGGGVVPRTSRAPRMHPEDMERWARKWGATDEMVEEIGSTKRVLAKAFERNRPQRLFRLQAHEQVEKYAKDTAQSYAFFVSRPGFAVQEAVKATAALKDPKNLHGVTVPPKPKYARENISDILYDAYLHVPDPWAQKMLLDSVVPRITSNMKIEHVTANMAILQAKKAMQWFADSPAGKYLEEFGPRSKEFMGTMRDLADPNVLMDGNSLYSGLAKFLYITHLGVNLGSVMMNMTQPLLLGATHFGVGPILKGYGRAFEEMGNYLKERVSKYGVGNITELERLELIHKNFKHADFDGENLIGVGPEVLETLETRIFSKPGFARKGRFSEIGSLMMKAFEKAEHLNRMTVGHAIEDLYTSAKRTTPIDRVQMKRDIRRAVQETQFGAGPLNTPLVFMPEKGRTDLAARVLSNPLSRMFLTFPLRSATGLFVQGPKLGGREGFTGALVNDFFRLMGINAFVYEFTKGVFGADMSPSLGAAAVTDVVGGERFLENSREVIPIPPIVDIPLEMARGAMTGDISLLRQQLPRLLPGGLALSRLMGVLPDASNLPAGGMGLSLLQKTHADWGRPLPTGEVPVYKANGDFIGYRKGSDLVLRGLGVDMGRFREGQELDNFLVKNRDEIVWYRREALRALAANDLPRVEQMKREFEKRFKIPLTATPAQLRGAIDTITTPRTERLLLRIPAELRDQYAKIVRESGVPQSVPPEALTKPLKDRRASRVGELVDEQSAFENFSNTF